MCERESLGESERGGEREGERRREREREGGQSKVQEITFESES